MITLSRIFLAAAALAALSACSGTEATNPTSLRVGHASFQGSAVDTSLASGGGGGGGGIGGGGIGGGGGSTSLSCGTLSTNVQAYNIVVYTTRIGIGFSGSAYNCGSKNEAFEVVVTDMNPDTYCQVALPHFIAAKNTAPGMSVYWSINSTLVNCMNTTHTFTLTLVDTKTGQTLATTTASAYL